MGTLWSLTVVCESKDTADRAFTACFAELERWDQLMSDYRADSVVNKITEEALVIEKDLAEVLSRALQIARDTEGAFDPAVGVLTKIWRRALRKRVFPSGEDIAQARAKSGYRFLEVDGQSVRVTKPGVEIDLGGIGKGVALSAVGELLERDWNITSYLIDAGGDVYAGAPPPGEAAWKIEVRGHADPIFLAVVHAGVATSGDLHQSAQIEGKSVSHIIDPRSGRALSEGASATVVAADPVLADALASALCVIGDHRKVAQVVEKVARDASYLRSVGSKTAWQQGMDLFLVR